MSVAGGELPIDGGAVGNAAIKALVAQDAQLDLGHVEPTAVLWGVVNLQLLCQPQRLLQLERLV